MTLAVPQQISEGNGRAAPPAASTALIVSGILTAVSGLVLILLSTIGQQAARRDHPKAEIAGVVVLNGFEASCSTLAAGQVVNSQCPAAAVRITSSSDPKAVPIGALLTITAPGDLTVGAEYQGSRPTSALPRLLDVLAVPGVIAVAGGAGAVAVGVQRRKSRQAVPGPGWTVGGAPDDE